jgi:branched-chain amino acid transport system substrate-binding protein
MLVADAIERAGSAKRKAVRTALEATDGFPGVTGSITFGPGLHIPEKEVTIVKAEAGQLKLAAVLQPEQVPEP